MFGKLLFFVAGMYAGVYVDQHYQLPKADDPGEIWKKIKELTDKFKKDDPGPKDK